MRILGLPSHVVWELARMPPSTLDYWIRTGLVEPTLRQSEGKRVERWWTVREAVIVRSIRALRQAGATLPQMRAAKRVLETWKRSLADVTLSWDGRQVVAEDELGQVALTGQPGQAMLQLVRLPIGEWARVARLRSEPVDLDAFRVRRELQALGEPLRVVPTIPIVGTGSG